MVRDLHSRTKSKDINTYKLLRIDADGENESYPAVYWRSFIRISNISRLAQFWSMVCVYIYISSNALYANVYLVLDCSFVKDINIFCFKA